MQLDFNCFKWSCVFLLCELIQISSCLKCGEYLGYLCGNIVRIIQDVFFVYNNSIITWIYDTYNYKVLQTRERKGILIITVQNVRFSVCGKLRCYMANMIVIYLCCILCIMRNKPADTRVLWYYQNSKSISKYLILFVWIFRKSNVAISLRFLGSWSGLTGLSI